jgi:hypothetical protein
MSLTNDKKLWVPKKSCYITVTGGAWPYSSFGVMRESVLQ